MVEILCVGEVTASTEDAAEYVVASGKKATVVQFDADAAFSKDSVVRLIWDYGGTDTLIWSIKGGAGLPRDYYPVVVGDGVKTLAVVCENGEAGSLFLAGRAKIRIDDV